MSETTLRIPSVLAGVAAVLLVYLLAARYAGRTRARLAAAMMATTYMVWWGARSVQMDILVTSATAASVAAAVWAVERGSAAPVAWVASGLAAGTGFLAKGPIGLICPALVVLAWLGLERRLQVLKPVGLLLAAGGCAAVVLPWIAWLLARGEVGFLREALVRQNVTRFLNAWDHRQPWWYYGAHFWMVAAPWSLFVPWGAGMPDRTEGERRLDRLAWAWIAALLLFFSMSQSKRNDYLLPLTPAVALLASGVLARWVEGRLPRKRGIAIAGVHILIGSAALAGAVAVWRALPGYPEMAPWGRVLGALLAAGGTGLVLTAARGRGGRPAASATLLALVFGIELLAGVAVLPAGDVFKSARGFANGVRARVGPTDDLVSYRLWDWRAEYAYYTRRRVRNLKSATALAAWRGEPGPGFVIVEQPELPEASRILGDRPPLLRARIGRRQAYLFARGHGPEGP